MRSGACSFHQALTQEAASVLKLSLNLARRRGHAQVTPLHVATTILTSSSSSYSNLLRRACLKSHPYSLPSHHLQCRALELCFNVALNRLPTTPPPSSGSLIQTQPPLSNALIAALKRAQAHQRRGCIEMNQQQQPVLAIKVELEQLIISILDDPSVSRVMKEAGFSSTTVKSNLEEDSSVTSSFFFDSNRELITSANYLHSHFLKPSLEQNPFSHFSFKEDLKVVLDVMVRKQGMKNNIVVVGDSVSHAEGVVSELLVRLESGDVPNELKSSHLIKLHLPHAHLRLMTKIEVDLKVSDLRRKVTSLAAERGNGGVIVYIGDLRWVLDEDIRHGFKPVDHLIEEVGRLVFELKTNSKNRVWLIAAASCQTYMRCKLRHPSMENQWALQSVVVPSGGPKLSLQGPSGMDSRVTNLTQYPFQMPEPKGLYHKKEEEDKLNCCSECTANFEREASVLKSEAKDNNSGSTQLPYWLQPQKTVNNHKDTLLELRRKWNGSCRNLHLSVQRTHPWWPNILTDNKIRDGPKPWLSDVKTTLALGNPVLADTATSMDQRSGGRVNQKELSHKLQENIPWQSETIPLIVESLLERQPKNGIWLLIQGTDRIGKRRLARVVAESFCRSTDNLIYINYRSSDNGVKIFTEALRKDPKCVVLIEDVDQASREFIKTLSECIKFGFLKDPFEGEVGLSHGIFILTTSSSPNLNLANEKNHDDVLKMRLRVEETSASDHKRKSSELESSTNEKTRKKMKSSEVEFELDLNVCAEESDLTHEMDEYIKIKLPNGLLNSIGSTITMDEIPGWAHRIEENIAMRLSSVLDGEMFIDPKVIEGLVAAMGWFLESEFEKWVREIFELNIATVRKGGNVRLVLEGKEGNVRECGFLGSVLPRRIYVD